MSIITVMPSIIGTFFSNLKRVEFSADIIAVHYKYGVSKSYSLLNCTGFACFETSLFNAKITFADDNNIEIGYLNKFAANILFTELEKRLALLLVAKLNQSKVLLKQLAFDEYLRDSSIPALVKTVLPLLIAYRKAPRLWHKHFLAQNINMLKKLSVFNNKEELVIGLRINYEQTILATQQNFFDNVEANPLTMEQRLAVIRDNDKNLVLAAAGTGKTSVMVAKSLDLIDRKLAKPEQILILAYNKEAANELKFRYLERCNKAKNRADTAKDISQTTPVIMTFHALGRLILTQSGMTTRLSSFVESPIKRQQWLSNWLSEQICQDDDFLHLFVKLLYQPVNVFDFTNQRSYQHYLSGNIAKRRYQSLAGYRVTGYEELLIANWLYINGIKHHYQYQYKFQSDDLPNEQKRKNPTIKVKKGHRYQARFYLSEADIYLEHIMIDRQGNTPFNLDKSHYLNEIQCIEGLHKAHKTQLVKTYHYDWLEGQLEHKLLTIMKRFKVTRNLPASTNMLNVLEKKGFIKSSVDKYLKCLQAMRFETMTDKDLSYRFQKHTVIADDDYKIILEKIYNGYVNELQKQEAIDFDDMIIQPIKALSSGLFKPNWSHILVDEFQDISSARFEFLQQLIKNGPQVRLTAVGDDWQSIYRFSGGKLELTTRFSELVGCHTLSKLQKTFRYNNNIADIAGRFVMENPEQFKKQVVTHTQVSSAQVFLLDDLVEVNDLADGKQQGIKSLPLKVQQVISTIQSSDPTASIAVISRYRSQLDKVKESLTGQVISNAIHFWTYHGAKGLEADYCILLGFEQGKLGFPNERQDELLVEALLPNLDNYPHSEERRLFYVGLTRAKHKAFIIANPDNCSVFVKELIEQDYPIKIASALF